MNTVTNGPACPACGESTTIHTEAEQDHVDGMHDWYCNDGDEVTCPCGAEMRIVLDCDGGADIVEVPS